MAETGRPRLLQGDIVTLDGDRCVILSRSCDLPREHPSTITVAPLVQTTKPDALQGFDLRQVRVPSGSLTEVVDLTKIRTVPKHALPMEPEQRGCLSERAVRQFRRDVGRHWSAPSLPEGVNKVIEPLWRDLRKRRDSAMYEPLIHAIHDVRARFRPMCDPGDELTERTMTIVFVIDSRVGAFLPEGGDALRATTGIPLEKAGEAWHAATTVEDRARALEAFCQALCMRCKSHFPVVELECEVVSGHEFSYDDVMSTDELRPEVLSR